MLKKNLSRAMDLLGQDRVFKEVLHRLEGLSEKLKKKELVLAVVGQFKRGKSSFINGILGEDILPTGIIPVTSVVTRIQEGDGYARIQFIDGREEKLDFNQLEDFISEKANPMNKKGVSFVDLFLPHDFLKGGLVLVDTPGVGSTHKHNTQETYNFMDQSDGVVFLLSVDSPINEIERDLLEATRPHASKFYFAVNKIDLVDQEDLEEYISYCKEILSQLMGQDEIRIWPISSKKNRGLGDFFQEIIGDIRRTGDKILRDSVEIKYRETLALGLSQADLYYKTLTMPIIDLENKKEELRTRLEALDSMTREGGFLMDWSTDSFFTSLGESMDRDRDQVFGQISEGLERAYQEGKGKRPRDLEAGFLALIEDELRPALEEANGKNLAKLEIFYEELVASTNKRLQGIQDFLKTLIWDLFEIDYHYEGIDYDLSDKNDYYVFFQYKDYKYLPDTRDLIYFLPRNYANKKLYDNYLVKTRQVVEANTNNMLYNYQYKLRESRRKLDSRVRREVDKLREDIHDFIDQVIEEKRRAESDLGDKLDRLSRIREALGELLNEDVEP